MPSARHSAHDVLDGESSDAVLLQSIDGDEEEEEGDETVKDLDGDGDGDGDGHGHMLPLSVLSGEVVPTEGAGLGRHLGLMSTTLLMWEPLPLLVTLSTPLDLLISL